MLEVRNSASDLAFGPGFAPEVVQAGRPGIPAALVGCAVWLGRIIGGDSLAVLQGGDDRDEILIGRGDDPDVLGNSNIDVAEGGLGLTVACWQPARARTA